MELDPAVSTEQRRADRAAEVELEAGGRALRRLAEQARTGNAAAANDARGLDAIDDRPGVGERTEGEGEGDAEAPR